MRKIALIMDGWKRFFTYAWPAGILQRIHETGEEVNLYIFNSSGNWSTDTNYNVGEYNIYNLPDLKEFDGIILELNNISSPWALQDVIERAKEADVPVLSIANELEDFYYVGIDNYQAMKNVIAHLHEKHGCEKYWFIMGPQDNYESGLRTKALRDYMKEHNLPFSKEDFCFGEFDYRSGVKGFKKLMENHEDKPDAIICVSDNIAVAVCETAKEYGYQVPRDFCVTGFDNFDKASYHVPSITTVGHIREEVGYLCADILIRLWKGEAVPKYNYTATTPVYQESCGCNSGTERDVREYLKGQIMYGIESEEFAAAILSLESQMMQCNTVEEMMYCIPQCIPSLKCDAMYLVLDEHINAYKKDPEKQIWSNSLTEEGFCVHGYPPRLQVKFAYEKNLPLDVENMEISDIFPMFDYMEGGKDFLFIPLHFGSRTIGFFVIRNAVYLMEKQYLFQIINALTNAMENLHKKERLEYMNRRLSTLYMVDPLTGLYNRMGYQKLGENFYNIMHAKGKRVLIMFIDLDGLKYINDTFGHEYGDIAIVTTAKAIMKFGDKDAVSARTGGDEYVVLQAFETDEALDKMIKDIRNELDWESKKRGLPFALSISVGCVATYPEAELTMAEYVKLADGKMYEEKITKKAGRR